jgi:hypothetical protein
MALAMPDTNNNMLMPKNSFALGWNMGMF